MTARGRPPSADPPTADSPDPASDPAPLGRRSLLASVPTVALLAGCLTSPDDDAAGDDEGAADPEPPFEVRTIEAPGSESGTIVVPETGTVTVCNFTRTGCPTSEGHLDVIRAANERIDDERVRVLSLVEFGRDPTSEDDAFADWWNEHDGAWTLAIDDDRAVFSYYGIDHTPSTIVLGGVGDVLLRERGGETPGDIARAVAEGLEALD